MWINKLPPSWDGPSILTVLQNGAKDVVRNIFGRTHAIVKPFTLPPEVNKRTMDMLSQFYIDNESYYNALFRGFIIDKKLCFILEKNQQFAQDFIVKFLWYAKQRRQLEQKVQKAKDEKNDHTLEELFFHIEQTNEEFIESIRESMRVIPLHCYKEKFENFDDESGMSRKKFFDELHRLESSLQSYEKLIDPRYTEIYTFLYLRYFFYANIAEDKIDQWDQEYSISHIDRLIDIDYILQELARLTNYLQQNKKGPALDINQELKFIFSLESPYDPFSLVESRKQLKFPSSSFDLFYRDYLWLWNTVHTQPVISAITAPYLVSSYDELGVAEDYNNLHAYYHRPLLDDPMRAVKMIVYSKHRQTNTLAYWELYGFLENLHCQSIVEMDVYSLLALEQKDLVSILSAAFRKQTSESREKMEAYFWAFQNDFFQEFESIMWVNISATFPSFPKNRRFNSIKEYAEWIYSATPIGERKNVHDVLLSNADMIRANLIKNTIAWIDIPLIRNHQDIATKHRIYLVNYLKAFHDTHHQSSFEQQKINQNKFIFHTNVGEWLDQMQIDIHFEISSRIKDLASVLVKMLGDPKYNYVDSLRDLSGMRCVIDAYYGVGDAFDGWLILLKDSNDLAQQAYNHFVLALAWCIEKNSLIYKFKGTPSNHAMHNELVQKLNMIFPHLELKTRSLRDRTGKTDSGYNDASITGNPIIMDGSQENGYSQVRTEIQIMMRSMKSDLRWPASWACYNAKKFMTLLSRQNRIFSVQDFYRICQSNALHDNGIASSWMEVEEFLKYLLCKWYLSAYTYGDNSKNEILFNTDEYEYRLDELRANGSSIRQSANLKKMPVFGAKNDSLQNDWVTLIPKNQHIFDQHGNIRKWKKWEEIVKAFYLNPQLSRSNENDFSSKK